MMNSGGISHNRLLNTPVIRQLCKCKGLSTHNRNLDASHRPAKRWWRSWSRNGHVIPYVAVDTVELLSWTFKELNVAFFCSFFILLGLSITCALTMSTSYQTSQSSTPTRRPDLKRKLVVVGDGARDQCLPSMAHWHFGSYKVDAERPVFWLFTLKTGFQRWVALLPY